MRTDSEVFSFVEAFGPTLVLLFAVVIGVLVLQKGWNSRDNKRHTLTDNALPLAHSRGELVPALEDADNLNSFDAHAKKDPGVHLGALVRFEPSEYRTAAYELARCYRQGKVISIDLGNLDSHQAARLVDFCSGMAAVSSGWIFRVTNHVIVLNPPN